MSKAPGAEKAEHTSGEVLLPTKEAGDNKRPRDKAMLHNERRAAPKQKKETKPNSKDEGRKGSGSECMGKVLVEVVCTRAVWEFTEVSLILHLARN